MVYLLLFIGFVLLLGGAEYLVKGSVGLARRFGISPLVIGMTVVAFGTSAPELVVSLNAAAEGAAGLATGNIIGSNIANILLILGITALIKPIIGDPKSVFRDGIILIVCSTVFTALCWMGELSLMAGLVLSALFIAFLTYSYIREKKGNDMAEIHSHEVDEIETPDNVWLLLFFTLGGMAAVIGGSELLVSSGTTIAKAFGVSDEVIGLTMIAVGTSLPELAASGMAALRGHTEVALGNVIGSNLFNILFVLGAVSILHPLPVSGQLLHFDLWVMMAATILLLPFMMTKMELSRWEGAVFFIAYSVYIAIQAYGVDRFLGHLA